MKTKTQSNTETKNIKFLVLDVDGVCTDGKLYYTPKGKVTKAFFAQDGVAILTALKLGIGVGIITGRKDKGVAQRAKDLGIKDYFAGHLAKLDALEEIKAKHRLDWEEMAYMGDDWIDLDPMLKVGYPIAVENARPEVKEVAKYITKLSGGNGAVREAIEHIFSLQGKTTKELAQAWIHE